ncbi:pirin family protein [Aquihabitans sp. G128]|uniref:pirin family protein n=1 Tax=Aquihabitans sp. G128 TaxID=2849779 RepID=UPI001C24546B|nr:pirin family protein [Aquihabitans sp. G128]QXC60799.1 pirin family protein [Aquihabitans sp. G128]
MADPVAPAPPSAADEAVEPVVDPVLQEVPLGAQWPTVDPFLFCAHHLDHYPEGSSTLGPAVPLEGREIGSDFASKDGWNMYHGSVVPGFPQHPHRGFETVTYVRSGLIDHSDSLGATARFGAGDTQWLTAGGGVVHSEMFPLVHADGPNDLHLFQIWLNLPAADKLVDPYFTMLWSEDTPRSVSVDDAGRRTEVTVIAGTYDGLTPSAPPPSSWAARAESDLAIWHLSLEAGATLELPAAAGPDTIRTIYVFEGDRLVVGGHVLGADTGAVVRCDVPVTYEAGDGGPVEVLVLQGRPIGEPVARYGPFVMNTEDEIEQAFADYRETGFGGWPWDDDAPHHGPTKGRFARHADGRVDERST